MKRRVHIWVNGRVQGVSYRATAQAKASLLALTGWVRNLSDGSVEILAEGNETEVSAFIEWCGQGPRWARVDEIKVIDEVPAGGLGSFAVRRDGRW